jgi:hypothetical protein
MHGFMNWYNKFYKNNNDAKNLLEKDINYYLKLTT